MPFLTNKSFPQNETGLSEKQANIIFSNIKLILAKSQPLLFQDITSFKIFQSIITLKKNVTSYFSR